MFSSQAGFVGSSYLNDSLLMQCGDPFKEEDMIVINGTKAEVEKLKQRMLERRVKAKSKVSLTPQPSAVKCLWWWYIQLWHCITIKHTCSVSEIKEEQGSWNSVYIRIKRFVRSLTDCLITVFNNMNHFKIYINKTKRHMATRRFTYSFGWHFEYNRQLQQHLSPSSYPWDIAPLKDVIYWLLI